MYTSRIVAAAAAMACAIPSVGHAQSSSELEQIRQQIEQLKSTYDKQIKDLERRLQDAEAAAAKAQSNAAQAQATAAKAEQAAQAGPVQPPPAGAARQSAQNAFNPGISLILNGAYGNFKQDPDSYSITGFQDKGAVSPGKRGLQLGQSELFIQSNIDHLFLGSAMIAFDSDSVSVEEANFQTLGLGHGLTIKAGRFFSGLGYQNAVHAHAWDFVDPALVQRAFLGSNYSDDGVRLSWIAPLPVYLEFGGEFGRGKSMPGAFQDGELANNDRNRNGVGSEVLYARLGGDLGDSHSYRIGLSHLRTSTGPNSFRLADFDTLTGVQNTWTNGTARLYGADLVWKWAPDGNYQYRNFKFVAEYFQLRRDGELTYDTQGAALTDRFLLKQTGWYAQGVYQLHPNWRMGLRYDQLDDGSFDGGANAAHIMPTGYSPKRYSAMVDWNPSEFSRLRLQYNRDLSAQNLTDDQIFLQYIFSLGAHGAHRY